MATENKKIDNPPFEILSCTMSNLLDDTGDDITLWWLRLKTPEYEVDVSVWFERLMRYCQDAHPDTYAYFNSIRRGFIGLGPKHSKVMDVLNEEGFDLMPLIREYIGQCTDIEAHHQQHLKLLEMKRDPVQDKELTQKAESMSTLVRSMRESSIRIDAFTDQVMEYLGTEVATHFPEIFNSDPKYIKEFHGKLINWMLRIREDVDSLSFKAGKEP